MMGAKVVYNPIKPNDKYKPNNSLSIFMLNNILRFFISKIRPNHKELYKANSLALFLFYIKKGLIPLLRSIKFKFFGIHCKLLFVGKYVVIDFPDSIFFGEKNIIGDFSRILGISNEFKIGNRNTFREFAWIQRSSLSHRPGVLLCIDNDNYFGAFLQIGIGGPIHIGSNNFLGNNIQIISENHRITDSGPSMTEVNREGIKIGNSNWIGNNVIILDGVTIGNNNVIAAGTVVNKSIGNSETHVGNPNKLIKNL